MRRPRRDRSDAEIRAHHDTVELLEAIGSGRLTRDGTGYDAPYRLHGQPMSPMWLKRMDREGLIFLPISGPPRIAPRGLEVLDDAGE